MLKFARPNTGEHWAEKIAAEIGNLIGVDCARVELADCGGELVTVCESFDPENWYELYEFVSEQSDWLEGEQIVVGDLDWANHVNPPIFQETIFLAGCDVLAWSKEQYDVEARFGQREHNVDTIVQAVKEVFQDLGDPRVAQVGDILQALASYALLDGLIGNTKRTLERIGAVDDAELWAAVDRVPTELMSETAKDFAYEVMLVSRTELLESAR